MPFKYAYFARFCLALSLLVAMDIDAFADEIPLWRTSGVPDSVWMTDTPFSAARWIWADRRIRPGQIVYFRCRFNAPENYSPCRNAKFQFLVDDFCDEIYLNGRKAAIDDIASAVCPGENVLALKVRNGYGSAGVLFRLFTDGRNSDIFHSDAAVKCAERELNGWTSIDFDDSGWKASYEIGDVTTAPWARRRPEIVRLFMTDAEWKNWQVARARAVSRLPPGLDAEPEPDARIVYAGWLPKIALNGELLEPDFSLPVSIGNSPYQEAAVAKLDSIGFPIVRITTADINFWKGDGEYDFADLDWQARRVLSLAPNTRFEVHLSFSKMSGWCRLHPDETVGYATGPADPNADDDLTQRVVRPSAASEAFREEATRVIAALGAFVRGQPWGKRAVAVRLGYGIYSEWHTYGMYEGPDSGRAMTAAFRDFLRRKYGRVDDATPPTMDERGSDVEVLDRKTHRKAIDFFECNANASADLMLFMARKTKEALPGRLVGAYYGYVFGTHPPEGTNLLIDKTLASPYIDFMSNPAAYVPGVRRAGGSYCLRNIPASFHRYGKLCVCEDDMRFHHGRSYELADNYATETPEESKATVKRNYLNRLFDGIGYQALDLSPGYRPAAFDDPAVLEGLYEAKRETAAAGDPGLDSGNSLAVVIDYRGRLLLGNNARKNASVRARYADPPERLYRTGMTFDMLTIDDYLAAARSYKHVLFLNPGEADPALLAAARRRAGSGALVCDGVFTSVGQYRALFEKAGVHAWIKTGSYVRHHGDLLMFHTGKTGHHVISLPQEFSGALSLTSGRRYAGSTVEVDVGGPHTELFRLERCNKGEIK